MAADDKFTSIKDLRPGMKNVTCVFIVIDRGTTRQIKDGSVIRQCRVADKTGSISFSLWNEQAEAIESGDILRLVRGYSSLWKGSLILYSGKYGQLEKIGEFTMVYSELPDMSDSSHDFVQQHIQKEKDQQEAAQSGHRDSRNGVNHSNAIGHGSGGSGSGQKSSGRHGLGQPGDGRRSYVSSPTGHYRPSPPPHTHTTSLSSQLAPLTTNSHPGGPPPTRGTLPHTKFRPPQNSLWSSRCPGGQ